MPAWRKESRGASAIARLFGPASLIAVRRRARCAKRYHETWPILGLHGEIVCLTEEAVETLYFLGDKTASSEIIGCVVPAII
jgi:hypothetical protein